MGWIVLTITVVGVCLWLYTCYTDLTSDKREKEAIKKVLKDAGYV